MIKDCLKKIGPFLKKHRQLLFQMFVMALVYKLLFLLLAIFINGYAFNKFENYSKLITDLGVRWDAGFYIEVARNGYGEEFGALIARFPLYPILLKIFSLLFGSMNFGAFILGWLCLFFAFLGLYKLVEMQDDHETAWRVILYLLIFPSAIFLQAIYTESLFLALLAWLFYFAKQGKWRQAAIFGFLLGLTRIEGMAAMVFLMIEYLQQNYKKKNYDNLLYAFSPLIGLLCFMIFCYIKFGDTLAFVTAQQVFWDRHFQMPWHVLFDYAKTLPPAFAYQPGWYFARFFDFLAVTANLIFAIIWLLKKQYAYAFYLLCFVGLSTISNTLASANRYQLIALPVVLLLGKWGKNNAVNTLIIYLFAGLYFIFTWRYMHAYWVG